MLQRYDYEDKRAAGDANNGGIRIYDRQNGIGREYRALAICTDKDQAIRIVDLLNADEAARQKPTNQVVTAAEMSKEPL